MSGEQVAVKVQRPDVLQSVTLDLYVIRLLLLFVSQWKSAKDSALSILGVIDNWADRFLQELDYLQEARNGDRFVFRLVSRTGWSSPKHRFVCASDSTRCGRLCSRLPQCMFHVKAVTCVHYDRCFWNERMIVPIAR